MKTFLFFAALCLFLGQSAFAQELSVIPTEGDHTLLTFDSASQTYSLEALDNENLLVTPPHQGAERAKPPQPTTPARPTPRPPTHPTPRPNPSHPRPNPRPHQPWHTYPGWHDGWHRDRAWHPGWWHAGYRFPVWIWIVDVPVGYWQCTAFNQSMQVYSRTGPDEDQAAYGALYACGGDHYQDYGCYVPDGYCQVR